MWHNKNSKLALLFIKLIAGLFVFIFIAVIIFNLSDSSTYYFIMKSQKTFSENMDKVYYKVTADEGYQPPDKKDDTNKTGEKGTGLNLLLINDIKTECYVKELLQLMADNQDGKLDDSKFHAPVEVALGITTNETGTYGGSLIPTSFIPYDNSTHTIQWGKEYKGFSAEEMKLRGFTKNQSAIAYTYPDYYQGPYQIDPQLKVDVKAKINGVGYKDDRRWDIYYYPDNLVYLNNRVSNYLTSFLPIKDDVKLDADLFAMCIVGPHNAGESGFTYPAGAGVPYTQAGKVNPPRTNADDYFNNLKKISQDLRGAMSKSNVVAPFMDSGSSRGLGAYLLCEAGWKLDDEGISYLTSGRYFTKSSADNVAKIIWGNTKGANDLYAYFRSKHSNLPFSNEDCENVYGMSSNSLIDSIYPGMKGHIYIVRDEASSLYKNKMSDGSQPKLVQYLPIETLGQMTQAMIGGAYYYGAMLKYAGVNVDPTNPETYLKKFKDNGEWVPDGETDWIKAYEVDTSVMTPEAIRVLNTGKQWFGSWYAWGGVTPPKKDANGVWEKPHGTGEWTGGIEIAYPGFDCSGFTQYIFKQAFGVDIGRSTYDQIDSPELKTISPNEAKPGDLVYFGDPPHHVGVFLKDLGSTVLIMHSPQTGDVVKVGPHSKGNMTFKRYPKMYPK